MSFEMRPSNNEAFRERLRSAEIRKKAEEDNVSRRPRVADKARSEARRKIEDILNEKSFESSFAEIWELV